MGTWAIKEQKDGIKASSIFSYRIDWWCFLLQRRCSQDPTHIAKCGCTYCSSVPSTQPHVFVAVSKERPIQPQLYLERMFSPEKEQQVKRAAHIFIIYSN